MDTAKTLIQISNALKELFKDKAELRGIEDWDMLIQCVVAIDKIAAEMMSPTREEGEEE